MRTPAPAAWAALTLLGLLLAPLLALAPRSHQSDVDRGRYLVDFGGCHDCHTNLTPHPTGLGNWTVEQLIQTIRTGKHLGAGRPILPPMPWFDIAKLTDEDLRAVFAYLRTLKPIENAVPAPLPPATARR